MMKFALNVLNTLINYVFVTAGILYNVFHKSNALL